VADNFGAQLKAFADKTGEKLEDVDRGFKLALGNRLVLNTRVDTGRLRGNWQVTTGAPAQGETGRLQSEANSALNASEAARIAPFSVTYFTNNVPYAFVWEERDGITGRAIADARRVLDEAVRDA